MMSKPKKATSVKLVNGKNFSTHVDASLALELEVGDDSAAYKVSKREVDELLLDDECLLCGDMLDVFGECQNPLCESHDDA
jgi:hypothetical protein